MALLREALELHSPRNSIPTHLNSGSLGLGCSDKAQAEAPQADKAH